MARALCHSLYGCSKSERLITTAQTWDQQVSRAFAAELLAPRAALASLVAGTADQARVKSLAEKFKVSERVIGHQLENARVSVLDE